VSVDAYVQMRATPLSAALATDFNRRMGFDLERSEEEKVRAAESAPARRAQGESVHELVDQALKRNLIAERFAIDAYRKIATSGAIDDEATLRLVKVALAVEEEHAEILTSIMEDLKELKTLGAK
jgi:bacterioferritin (cytochrome b1)